MVANYQQNTHMHARATGMVSVSTSVNFVHACYTHLQSLKFLGIRVMLVTSNFRLAIGLYVLYFSQAAILTLQNTKLKSELLFGYIICTKNK